MFLVHGSTNFEYFLSSPHEKENQVVIELNFCIAKLQKFPETIKFFARFLKSGEK